MSKPTHRKPGRPSKFTEKLATNICELRSRGYSKRQICEHIGNLTPETLRVWLRDKSEFSANYAKATSAWVEDEIDSILEIADDSRNDWIERKRKDGKVDVVFNAEAAARARLRIDTRKWIACKLLPKVYGDKAEIVHEVKEPFWKKIARENIKRKAALENEN